MRTAALLPLALSGLLAGLAWGQPSDRVLPEPERPVTVGEPATPQPDPDRAVPGTCETLEIAARALLEEGQACTSDVGCEVMSFTELLGPDSCVAAFQCSTAVSGDFDRAAFLERAAPLVVEKRACGECAMAACMPPTELTASCVQGRCELVPR